MSLSSVQARPRTLDATGLDAVDALLAEHVSQQSAVLRQVSPELSAVVRQVEALVKRGKRLRAAFCLWGARAARGPDDEQDHEQALVAGSAEAGAALEMFHLAALVHDDVMDRSDTRRGVPTVHRAFATRHRGQQLLGDPDVFGDGVAVLVGDLCLTWSDDLLAAGLAAAPATAAEARRVWEQMRTQVLAGQYLDLLAEGRPVTSVADATRVLQYKSAKYTVEHPLLLGAALAGATPALADGFRAFGLRVGEAFQLRDDVLGVLGDPEATGKSSYDDVRDGKRTLLMALADERADPAQRAVLRRHLGDPDLDARGLLAVREVLGATDALSRVETRIADLAADAHEVLRHLPVGPRSREALAALTDACAWRSA